MHAQDYDLLMQDHAELGALLDQLIATLQSNDVARSYAILDLFWARLAVHIRAEHLHLFEAILQAVGRKSGADDDDASRTEEARRIIEELSEDHNFFMRELSQAVAVMRGLLRDPGTDLTEQLLTVRQRINAVQERLVKHNEIEEKGIYVWTRTLLTQSEQSELAARMKRELQNMPPRFA